MVHNVDTNLAQGVRMARLAWLFLRGLLAGTGCVLCSLGVGGPSAVSYAGAVLLLVALPLPHWVRGRRLRRSRGALAAVDASATAVGLTAPSALFLAVQTGSDLVLGLVAACLVAALTVSTAARQELGPPSRGKLPAEPGQVSSRAGTDFSTSR